MCVCVCVCARARELCAELHVTVSGAVDSVREDVVSSSIIIYEESKVANETLVWSERRRNWLEDRGK